MLEVSTKRKEFEFKVDGEVYSLPVSLPLDEARKLAAAARGKDSDAKTAEWFADMLGRATGGKSDSFGDIELTAVINAWTRAREEAGEPGMGEP